MVQKGINHSLPLKMLTGSQMWKWVVRIQCVKCDVRDRLWAYQPWRGKEGFLEEVMSKGDLKDE